MSNIIRSTTDLAMHIAREYIRPDGVIVDATCGNGHDTLALAKAAREITTTLDGAAARDVAAARDEVRIFGFDIQQEAIDEGDGCFCEFKLLAFDIQQEAIDATRRLLTAEGFGPQLADGSIRLICDSHENMRQYLVKDITMGAEDRAAGAANQALKVNLIMFNLGYLPGSDKNITTRADSSLEAIKAGLALLARDGAVCVTMYSGHPEGAKEKALILDFARNLDSRKFHVAYVDMANQPNNPPELLIISKKMTE